MPGKTRNAHKSRVSRFQHNGKNILLLHFGTEHHRFLALLFLWRTRTNFLPKPKPKVVESYIRICFLGMCLGNAGQLRKEATDIPPDDYEPVASINTKIAPPANGFKLADS